MNAALTGLLATNTHREDGMAPGSSLSIEAVTTRCPSGLNCAELTVSSCFIGSCANARTFLRSARLLLCPGGGFLPDPDDFVASLLGEGA
jgi:hypothetical protein